MKLNELFPKLAVMDCKALLTICERTKPGYVLPVEKIEIRSGYGNNPSICIFGRSCSVKTKIPYSGHVAETGHKFGYSVGSALKQMSALYKTNRRNKPFDPAAVDIYVRSASRYSEDVTSISLCKFLSYDAVCLIGRQD